METYPLREVAGFAAAAALLTALACALAAWAVGRSRLALRAALLRGELEAAHSAALRAEGERRAVAQERAAMLPALEAALREQQRETAFLHARNAELEVRLEEERRSAAVQAAGLERARAELSDAFRALSADALRQNNQTFLDLAGATLTPVRESLDRFDGKINDLERLRAGAYESLTAQVHSLVDLQHQLRGETANLVNALRRPNVRGRWGEMQLRRVVELAGMLDHCDFTEQTHLETETGRQRPDLLVRLPAGKIVVVDAKTPLDAYFDAARAPGEAERAALLRRHAAQVRAQVDALSRKAYWEQFPAAPEFAVLFLPGENFFAAALEHDPALIEHGVDRKIIIATPTTLIALLRAVYYGWRQETLARNAQVICELGRDLYKRIAGLNEHFTRLGASLDGATRLYNQAAGSLESRVLVTARRFRELDAAGAEPEIPAIPPVESLTRPWPTAGADTE